MYASPLKLILGNKIVRGFLSANHYLMEMFPFMSVFILTHFIQANSTFTYKHI